MFIGELRTRTISRLRLTKCRLVKPTRYDDVGECCILASVYGLVNTWLTRCLNAGRSRSICALYCL